MFQILDFLEKFCWRRRRFTIANQNFLLIAGHDKYDAYELNLEEAMNMQGYLIGNRFLYMIPTKKGVFSIHDMIFAVNKLGVWCGFH